MTDPFSVAVSIGGLIQLADLVVNKTWPFLKEVKNQRSEISKLSSEVASLAGTLHSLRLLSEGSAVAIKREDIFDCQSILEEIRNKLEKTDGIPSGKRDQVKKLAHQLCFPYERAEIQKTLERLERMKSTFGLALTAESIASQIDLKADVKAVKDELFRRKELEAKIELDDKQRKVLDYFGRVSPKENHAMSVKLRHEGTGLWLLQEPRFKRWLQNCDSHIWLYGIPGAGKTVLASLLIDKVLQVCKPAEGVAFFYCDYKDTEKQEPCNIIASIASQLAIQHEKACNILEEEYNKMRPGTNEVKHLKAEILVNVLKKQLRLFDLTTIVIDGLDECGDKAANVLDHLVLLAQEFKTALRLAILSRDEHIISTRLTEIDCDSISIAATSSDIRLYAASEIEQRVRSGRLLVENPSTKEMILQKLIDKAQGMFRWVTCQLDFICDLTSDDEYLKAMDVAPPTLFGIYEHLLLRLHTRPKSTQDLIKSALTWILFSRSQLSIKALSEAVTIRTSGANSDKKPAPAALSQIRKFCSSLIRESADGKHLEVAHFTVKEFFNSVSKESHPHMAYFCLSKEEAYLEFSKICLAYLNLKDFRKPIPPFDGLDDAFEDHPFYEHAAIYWDDYANHCWADGDVLRLAKQLFKPPISTNFKLWRNRMISLLENAEEVMERINSLGDSNLHWAAFCGIHELLDWLVSCGQDVDCVAALGTPLSATLFSTWDDIFDGVPIKVPPYTEYGVSVLSFNYGKKETCVKKLLQMGARMDYICECTIGDETCNLSLRELLLYSGNIQSLEMTSLKTGFFDEHVARRIKKIIKYIEDWNLDDDMITLREKLVSMLRIMPSTYIVPEFQSSFGRYVDELENGIKVNYDAMHELWEAAYNDQTDVLESLLVERRGININLKGDLWEDDEGDHFGRQKSALHYAASAGSFDCIQVLLDRGAKVSTTTERGCTALHCAAGSSDVKAKRCIEMLVDAGLPLDGKDDKDRTVLHFAALGSRSKTVGYLLKKGSKPHLRDSYGCTAYHLAAKNGSFDVLKQLLEHETGGISGMHVSNADGFKPAQLAIVEDKCDFIWELLKFIDIKELDDKGEPFLLFAARNGSAEMMKVILRSNPDIHVRGNDQATILHAMAENDSDFSEIIRNVVQKGISRSDRRNDGSTPLHILLSGCQPVSQKLLDIMIEGNPGDVDGEANNYLMCLLGSFRPASQKKDIASDLVKHGVDAFQKNKRGDFFYRRFTETNPDLILQIMPHINNLTEMDDVHWILARWWTIHFAIIQGGTSFVKTLLENGSCLSKQTGYAQFVLADRQLERDKLNCMHVAALHGRKDILEYILEATNLPIDGQDGCGGTALHLAAFNGSDACVNLLLSKGADVKIQDSFGDNALHYAVSSKVFSVVETLVGAGTPIVANKKGESPVSLAAADEHGIAKLLRGYQTSNGGESDDLSRFDETREVFNPNLPLRFGLGNAKYTFEFNSELTVNVSKATKFVRRKRGM